MKLLYDVKNKTIRECTEGSKEVKLSQLENRCIAILSNGNVCTWKDAYEYVYQEKYDHYDRLCRSRLTNVYKRLTHKINLDIRNVPGIGIVLNDEVFIV